ncbi:MAG: SDR family NAD(P)-dependent oxidoreductase [bacterium]|nr:SDR family NAD(P)-dependent oxidoreductase [bacterium]
MKVIITGASKGIGRGIAAVLGRAGFSVGLLARSTELLESLQASIQREGGTAFFRTVDLRRYESVEEAIHGLAGDLGGLDALINNAGLVIRKDVFTISQEEWKALIETNVNGLFYATRAALSHFVQQKSGHIINVSSISGYVPLPGGSAYAASKYAVTGFSESLFHEVRNHNIKVTTVFPGSVDSESHRHDPDEDHSWKVTPEEVGEACLGALRTAPGNCISRIEIRPLNRNSRK